MFEFLREGKVIAEGILTFPCFVEYMKDSAVIRTNSHADFFSDIADAAYSETGFKSTDVSSVDTLDYYLEYIIDK